MPRTVTEHLLSDVCRSLIYLFGIESPVFIFLYKLGMGNGKRNNEVKKEKTEEGKIFIHITKCSNQFKYILYADDSTLSSCVPGDNVMDSAELINSELKCFDKWLKWNKIKLASMHIRPSSLIIKMKNSQILLLLKKVGSARLRENDIHPISPKTSAPQYQPIDI